MVWLDERDPRLDRAARDADVDANAPGTKARSSRAVGRFSGFKYTTPVAFLRSGNARAVHVPSA